ncbi:hypothetical protein [Cellulomonas sp. Marseille-Q8402]
MSQQISRVDLRLPDRWCAWRPGDAPRVAQRLAAGLTTGPVAAARLRAALTAVDRAVVELNARHVRAAAWVPEPSGDVVGGLACELLAEAPTGDGAANSYLLRVKRKIYRSARVPTRTTFHASTLREVPAGEAVVTLRSHGVTRHEVIWTVFAPDAAEAVELRFDTRDRERYQDLIAHAETIATALQITVARPRPSVVTPRGGAPTSASAARG